MLTLLATYVVPLTRVTIATRNSANTLKCMSSRNSVPIKQNVFIVVFAKVRLFLEICFFEISAERPKVRFAVNL